MNIDDNWMTNWVAVRPVIESRDSSALHKDQATASTTSMIDSFAELKHEVRDEVQRINHKMTRLEDILGNILAQS